jgi:hypothetical protein
MDGESINLLDDSDGELYEIPDGDNFDNDEDAADADDTADASPTTEYMDET